VGECGTKMAAPCRMQGAGEKSRPMAGCDVCLGMCDFDPLRTLAKRDGGAMHSPLPAYLSLLHQRTHAPSESAKGRRERSAEVQTSQGASIARVCVLLPDVRPLLHIPTEV